MSFRAVSGFLPQSHVSTVASLYLLKIEQNKEVRFLVQCERIAHFEDLNDSMTHDIQSGSIAAMYSHMKHLKNRKPPKLYRLHDDNDISCTNVIEEKQLVRIHFSHQLAGCETPCDALVTAARSDPAPVTLKDISWQDVIQFVPTL